MTFPHEYEHNYTAEEIMPLAEIPCHKARLDRDTMNILNWIRTLNNHQDFIVTMSLDHLMLVIPSVPFAGRWDI